MSEGDLETILAACKPVPAMMIGGTLPSSPQENANRAWAALGKKMGFDHMTVRPISGKGDRFFTAVPSENETQRDERQAREEAAARVARIASLEAEIAERQARLAALNPTPERTNDEQG